MTFKIGDRVRSGNQLGTVVYGPYQTPGGSQTDRVLVEFPQGVSQRMVSGLVAAPAFAVGDVATHKAPLTRSEVRVIAGPFEDVDGLAFYVVEKVGGSWQRSVAESVLERIDAPQPLTYQYSGKLYDLSARYLDGMGNVWTFSGRFASGGMPLMDCEVAWFKGIRLSEAVSAYGPFTV